MEQSTTDNIDKVKNLIYDIICDISKSRHMKDKAVTVNVVQENKILKG